MRPYLLQKANNKTTVDLGQYVLSLIMCRYLKRRGITMIKMNAKVGAG